MKFKRVEGVYVISMDTGDALRVMESLIKQLQAQDLGLKTPISTITMTDVDSNKTVELRVVNGKQNT